MPVSNLPSRTAALLALDLMTPIVDANRDLLLDGALAAAGTAVRPMSTARGVQAIGLASGRRVESNIAEIA